MGGGRREKEKRDSLKRRKRGFRYTCKFCVAGRIGIAKTLIREEIIFSFFYTILQFELFRSSHFKRNINSKLEGGGFDRRINRIDRNYSTRAESYEET